MILNAALLQLRTPDTHEAAIAHLEPLVREAAATGAKFLLTPEGSNILQRRREPLFEAMRTFEDDPLVRRGRELAAELHVWLLLGSVLVRREDGSAANRSTLIDERGAIRATYDKIHMFDVDLPTGERWRESNAYAGGDRAVLAQTPWGLLGVTICYDLRFPQLYRALAEAGAGVLTIPSCFTRQTGEAHWHVLQRARAVENGAFVIAAAQGGKHEDGRETYGHSLIVDPWGRVLAEGGTEPGVILAEVDLALVADARQRIPSLQHGRPFHVDVVAPAPQTRAASA